MKFVWAAAIVWGTIFGMGCCLAADAPADVNGKPASVVIHSMSGKTIVIPVDSKKAAELLADPSTKPLDGDIAIFVVDGKAYMIPDHKMASGRMFIQDLMVYDSPNGGG